MSDESGAGGETVRCWLVEREYWDKNLVTLVYATPDGERHVQMQRSSNLLARKPATAAIDVEAEKLSEVTDEETRERYAREAARVAENNDPDAEV